MSPLAPIIHLRHKIRDRVSLQPNPKHPRLRPRRKTSKRQVLCNLCFSEGVLSPRDYREAKRGMFELRRVGRSDSEAEVSVGTGDGLVEGISLWDVFQDGWGEEVDG